MGGNLNYGMDVIKDSLHVVKVPEDVVKDVENVVKAKANVTKEFIKALYHAMSYFCSFPPKFTFPRYSEEFLFPLAKLQQIYHINNQ